MKYRLPNNLSDFQRKIYNHLVDYKKTKLKISDCGSYKDNFYDIILPENLVNKNLLTDYQDEILDYIKKEKIRKHIFFSHLASSQVACFNLFYPIKLNKNLANQIFKDILPEFYEIIDIEFEYYDKKNDYLNESRNKGNNTANVGTDSDIAIIYKNKNNEKIISLIEHKFTENHFTNCNAFRSKNNDNKQICNKFDIDNTDDCYYKKGKNYKYWEITKNVNSFFDITKLQKINEICPFKSSLQQLWRNMLLADAIENDSKNDITRTYFGVIYHSENPDLWKISGNKNFKRADEFFNDLLKSKNKFFTFTIQQLVDKIKNFDNKLKWINEYTDKYIND